MRKLWLSLLFLAGGMAHELRNPLNCQCVGTRPVAMVTRRQLARRQAAQSRASTVEANT